MGGTRLQRRFAGSGPHRRGAGAQEWCSIILKPQGWRWWVFSSMRVDPQVNRIKFDCELGRLVEQRVILEQRGIFVLSSTRFPYVDVLVVPRHALQVALPPSPGMQLPPGVQMPAPPANLPEGTTAMMLIAFDVPSLAVRAFKGRFDLTDYDLRAPSLEFLDPWTDAPLTYGTMFRAVEFEPQRRAH